MIDQAAALAGNRRHRWLVAILPYAGLMALNVLFRVPLLFNAGNVHSDAAIAGLQATHLLLGESSRFLWGVTHQGAFDVWVIAAFFLIGGPTPLMLMLAPFAGHLVLSCVLFALLSRLLSSRAAAFILCLTLVFTPHVVNGIVAYVPRQWSITVALCGAMLIAWPTRHTPVRLAIGASLAVFSIYLDVICMLWMPALAFLTALICLEQPKDGRTVAIRAAAAVAGTLIGVVLVAALRAGAGWPGTSDFTLHSIGQNWPMLRDVSLPWLLGARVWIPAGNLYPDLWKPPTVIAAFQWLGAASAILLVLASATMAFTTPVRWAVKGLVLFGVTAAATTLGGFLTGGFASDMWSTRYLGPVIWSLPFSLAGLAASVRAGRLMTLLTPYLIVAALGGWLSYGPWVDGARSHFDGRGENRNEVELGNFLRERGYRHGYAPYWLAYRLTFLWGENPRLAALDADRYYPYFQAAERAHRKVFIFHPNEPRIRPEPTLAELRRLPGRVEVREIGGYTVVLYDDQ